MREAYSDRFPLHGFTSLVISRLAEPVAHRIRLEQTVHTISKREEGTIELETHAGERFAARHVIIALPLGVLKGKHAESRVTFDPPLSKPKRQAIRSLGFGTENKVIMRFNPEDIFWDASEHYMQCTDVLIRFVNLHCYGQIGTVVAFVSPPLSIAMMGKTDDRGCVTAGKVLSILYTMYVLLMYLERAVTRALPALILSLFLSLPL
jgi:monoamine oxidase